MGKLRVCMIVSALIVVLGASTTRGDELMKQGCPHQTKGISSCRRYLRESSHFRGAWRQEFPRCCEQLEQIDVQECRCDAIKQVVEEEIRQAGGGGGGGGKDMEEEMLLTAQSLPALCRISPQYCLNIRASPPPHALF